MVMSERVTIETSTLTDIADAIRLKTGTTNTLNVNEMANTISSITGTGTTAVHSVNGKVGDVVLTPEDIGIDFVVDPTLSVEGNAADAKATGEAINNINASKVPITRTINGKPLTTDITLTAEDVGVTIKTDTTLKTSGMAADAKVTGEAIANLNTLVGNTSVSEQIAEVITEVYVQNDEPVEAPEGSIWVDLDADGAPAVPGKKTANVYVVDAGTTDITRIDFSQYAIGDVVVVTAS